MIEVESSEVWNSNHQHTLLDEANFQNLDILHCAKSLMD